MHCHSYLSFMVVVASAALSVCQHVCTGWPYLCVNDARTSWWLVCVIHNLWPASHACSWHAKIMPVISKWLVRGDPAQGKDAVSSFMDGENTCTKVKGECMHDFATVSISKV